MFTLAYLVQLVFFYYSSLSTEVIFSIALKGQYICKLVKMTNVNIINNHIENHLLKTSI
jgi:hypothetical protein